MDPTKHLEQQADEVSSAEQRESFVFPVSFAQGRLWLLSKLIPDPSVYNMPMAVRLSGPLNIEALRASFNALLERHEVLRAGFQEEDGSPVQVIPPPAGFDIPLVDYSNLPLEDAVRKAQSLAHESGATGFDLSKGPMLRACLVRLADQDHVLVLTIHHIVFDAWSRGLLWRELSEQYRGLCTGAAPNLPDLEIQYTDFSVWQRDYLSGETLEEQLRFWKQHLSGAPESLELPTDRPRPALQTFNGTEYGVLLPKVTLDGLKELSRREGATLFMTLLAAFNVLLARYSGQEDIVLGTPIAGRNRTELENLIGFFVNTLPLRTDLSGNPTFKQLLSRVRSAALGAYAHQELPFEKLVEELKLSREISRHPVFQVMFALQNVSQQKLELSGLSVEPFRSGKRTTAKFDLLLTANEAPDGLALAFEYNTDLFDSTTIERMARALRLLLTAIAEDASRAISDLPIMEASERQQVLVDFNSTKKAYGETLCVHRLVEDQVERTPLSIAVVYNDEQLSYAQLNERSNQLAHYFRTSGIGPGSLVAICMERSLEMIVSVLATLKSGAAYVPLDPEYPKDRLAFMLEDSQAALLVTQERLYRELNLDATRVLFVDSAWDEIAAHSRDNPVNVANADDMVYVIYTSGSTGKPKGVCLPHRSLSNLLYWQLENSSAGVGDRTLQFTSLSFDVSFQEIFATLTSGGSLVLISESTRRDSRALLQYLKHHAITRLFQPFVALQQLAEAADEEQSVPATLREIITAGEQLKITQQIVNFFQRSPNCRLFNHYGPSETHVVTSYELCGNAGEWATLPPIGRPIANTQIFILDSKLNPVPVGVSGELHIAGTPLAKGYLRRPDLTAQRFIPNPFGTDPTDRLYKTGDLCRYLPDGNIQYLGRIDTQVKFRGYRVELGEIESALAKHPAVQQAAVILREDVPGDKKLVAYLVQRNGSIDSSELRSYLKQSLPEYMVPSAFVRMDALPLTPSGKVNRRNLPAPEWDETAQATAPSSPIEELLVGIWSEILRRKGFGVHDNFFDLGGHSLLATQLISRIRRTLQVDLPLRLVFEHPTISELAQDIDRGRGRAESDNAPRLIRRPQSSESPSFPLSFAEQRLWMVDRLDPNSSVYNLSVSLRFQGDLHVHALEQSLSEILRRHEVLRASFRLNGDEPEQIIAPAQPVSLNVVDVSADTTPEAAAREYVRKESQRPFNLTTGPLWRASLVKLACDDHVLLINVHHAVFDGWSSGLLIRELTAHYTAVVTGSPSQLPELEIQYPDFAVWQREYLSGERLDRQVNYWKKQLEGAPAYIDLPADHPRPQMQTFRGAQLSLTIPSELTARLKDLSHKSDSTLFMTLLGAFGVLLSRYSAQDDVVIGSPIAGRTRAETENLIGFFVNTIALRTSIAGNPSFRQLLATVKKITLDAYTHQDLPFEKLVEELQPARDLSRNPIFQVMFALQNIPRETIDLPGLKLLPFRAGHVVNSKFDLSLVTAENGDSIHAVFEYNTDLFESERIERMRRHWMALLEGIVANPDCPVSELPLMEVPERQQVLVEWNATTSLSPSTLLHQFVEQQSARTPDAVAVIDGTKRISYRELNGRANQLARKLQKLGVGPEVLVAVCSERCADMIVALLAVLKAGAAYVPLDPTYPKDRLAKILEDSRASVMIAQHPLASILPPHSAQMVFLDRDWPEIATEPDSNLETAVGAQNLAYVLFTSGSTGRPKGVALEHRSASIFVQWAQTVFTTEELSGTLFGTSICFDLSIFEMFVPLSVGGTVIIAQNALALRELPAANQVRLINTVPSAIAELVRMNAVPSSILTINLAGEALPETLAHEIYRQTGVRKLYNLYGPTEDTTYSTYTLVPRSGEVTIGRPIANTQAYILDTRRQPVPIGVPGELYLAGDGLARGYYGRDDLTRERFVPNPFSNEPSARMYRTGDRCRYRNDGTIEYLGRIDNQVKLRGFRIELGEIEAVLNQHKSVRQSVAIVREDMPGNPQLVAYVVTLSTIPDLAAQLRKLLSESLPNYMVPSAIVELEAFPLTPNGKVDRRALPPPDDKGERRGEFVAAHTPTEEIIAGIWAHVLQAAAIGIHDNFFELGGHSLLAMQVISRVSHTFSVELGLLALFETPTVAGLAETVTALRAKKSGVQALPMQRVSRTEPLQLSFAQQRLWFLDRLEPNTALYNVPLALRLRGTLHLRALRNALNRIVARHESLRTWFRSSGGAPVQMITPSLEVDLRVTNLLSVPVSLRESEARRLIRSESDRPFDLTVGPLIRILLVRITDNDHVLVINTHHITSDRWSLNILREELIDFYEQEISGEVRELPALPIQYADYAAWQRELLSGEMLEEQLRYWKQKLAGAPASLDLPTDRPRPAEQSYRGAVSVFDIPKDVTEQLLALGRREGTTLFMTLLAAFNVLLSCYSGQDDIVVGSPIAGRSRPEIEKVVGFFLNTLVLRTQVVDSENFRQLLARVRETAMGAYAHQDVPFEKLVEELKPERDLSRNPIFQVMFTAQNAASTKQTMGGLELGGMQASSPTSKFDLTVSATERESGVRVSFEYATDLFDAETIKQLQQHWLTLLQAIVANPDQAIADLPLLNAAEKHKILHEWNATDREFEHRVCVHDLVARRAAVAPEAVAVEMSGEQLTYAELNARANRLAQHLRTKGLKPQALVGIYLERSIDMVVALLGTLKAGGAYVPLDPAYPADRIAFIAEDAQLGFLLTQSELARKAPATSATIIDLRGALRSEEDTPAIVSQSLPEHLAYVLYTSGSTGKPKGVQITHGNLTNFLLSMQQEPGFSADDTLLAVTTLSFDIAGLELYLPLVSGGKVTLASREDAADARALRYLLELHRPTVMQATPATWRMLIESGWDGAPNLKVLCGGEALPSDLALQLVPRCSELWNMYGPTETTVWSSIQRVREVAGTAPIGRPIANTTFYILDSRQQPVPIGVAGELYIGGEGVARGYLNRPELTAERFVRDPFSKKEGARMYRTGDLARYLRDGTVQYLGRTDFQVKVRGFRIELGEIENQLAKHPAVQQVVVAAREDVPGDKRLVAYVVPKPGEHLSLPECRAHLKQSLPEYMVPSAVVELTALPLTPNGKVDRKALPKPNVAAGAMAGTAAEPRDALEEKLLALWRRVLKNSTMGVTDNFFDLGGHSLMAAQLMSEIENALGRRIPMAVLFRGATVAEMASVLRDGTEFSAEPIAMRIQPGRTTPFFAIVAPDMDSIGYAALAQAMGPQQTFYKLQLHRAVKPDAPITLDEMRAIARDYVQAMKTVQPHGPYYIGGMCAGTHIGEQMILQLEAEGEKVAVFAIFDTWVRQNSHVRWKWRIYYYHQRLRGMLRMSFRRQMKMIGDALSKKLHRVATGQKRVETSFAKLYWPGKDFKTPHFQAPVALFKRPRQPFYYIKDETMGWSERSEGGVHIYRIDFPHQMLREPYIREVAKRLLECISRATPAAVERLQVWPKVNDQTPSAIDVEA